MLDIIYMVSGRAGFATAAGHVIGIGLVTGLVAAVSGLVAWTTIARDSRARRAGMWHSRGNVVVLMLFTASWFIRLLHSWVPSPAALVCGLAGLALAGLTGWLAAAPVVTAPVPIVPRQQPRK